MIKIFEKCGYLVNSPNKKQNLVVNVLDGLLVLGYVILSFINLSGATPSELVFFLNIIALGRLILKNIIEQSKIAKTCCGTDTKGITLVHVVKIIAESVVMIMVIAFYLWGKFVANSLEVVKFIVGIVLLITLVENLWSVFERVYDATPKPLKC